MLLQVMAKAEISIEAMTSLSPDRGDGMKVVSQLP